MKNRNGFVSNSSSSSFVVIFDHKPESKEELKQMMFGKNEYHFVGDFFNEHDTDYHVDTIVDFVYPMIAKKESADFNEVYESIRNGWFEGYTGFLKNPIPGIKTDSYKKIHKLNLQYDKPSDREAIQKIYDDESKVNDKNAKKIAEEFLSYNSADNKFVLVIEFTDNEGDLGSICEHTDIFFRLPHIQTSYH